MSACQASKVPNPDTFYETSSSSSYSFFVLDKILIHEDEYDDEYEMNHIKSHIHTLSFSLILKREWKF